MRQSEREAERYRAGDHEEERGDYSEEQCQLSISRSQFERIVQRVDRSIRT